MSYAPISKLAFVTTVDLEPHTVDLAFPTASSRIRLTADCDLFFSQTVDGAPADFHTDGSVMLCRGNTVLLAHSQGSKLSIVASSNTGLASVAVCQTLS